MKSSVQVLGSRAHASLRRRRARTATAVAGRDRGAAGRRLAGVAHRPFDSAAQHIDWARHPQHPFSHAPRHVCAAVVPAWLRAQAESLSTPGRCLTPPLRSLPHRRANRPRTVRRAHINAINAPAWARRGRPLACRRRGVPWCGEEARPTPPGTWPCRSPAHLCVWQDGAPHAAGPSQRGTSRELEYGSNIRGHRHTHRRHSRHTPLSVACV